MLNKVTGALNPNGLTGAGREVVERMLQLGMPRHFGSRNPFPFMDLQDVQELTNFFERRVSAYQVGVQGEVAFDEAF